MMSPNNEATETAADGADTAEFNAAFEELASAGSDTAAQGAQAAAVDGQKPEAEADGAGQTEAHGAEAGDAAGAGAGAPEGGAEIAAGGEAAAAQAVADIWATATEEQRAAYRKMEQQWRSDAGRIAAFQRRTNEVQAELAALKAARDSGAQGTETRPQEQDETALAALRSEYPEVADPVLKLLKARDEKIDRLSARLSVHDSRALEQERSQEAARLAELHPDWGAIGGSAAFVEWLQRQPAYVIETAQRNGNQIVNAEEAADIIGRFKASQHSSSAPVPQPAPASTSQSDASRDNARRQRQLSSGVGPTKGAGPGAGPADDFDAAFDFHAKQVDPRRGAVYR